MSYKNIGIELFFPITRNTHISIYTYTIYNLVYFQNWVETVSILKSEGAEHPTNIF